MVGYRLKQLRLARNLSLEALAAEMDGIVTKQAISKYENGTSQPSPDVMTRLARVLGVKAAYFFRDPTINLEFIAYRRKSGLGKREMERVKKVYKYWK